MQALLLLTEWEEFRQLDLLQVLEVMEVPIMVDGRNLFDPVAARKAGFEYVCMGREGVGVTGLRTCPGTTVV